MPGQAVGDYRPDEISTRPVFERRHTMDRPDRPAPWYRRLGRALLLGVYGTLALAAAAGLIALVSRKPLLRTLMWTEFAGGTLVCGIGALLLVWRPQEPCQTEEREKTADVGFGLFVAGLVAFLSGLWVSWAWGI
ncbi:MAG: DUF2231 domain-containing protein [Methanocella sp.]